jgi:RHS repeat-associated protein
VNSGTPETTYYVYDYQGRRVRKVTESQSGAGANAAPARMKDCIYLQDYEIFRRYAADGTQISLERTTLNANSETGCVARIESRAQGTDAGAARLARYQFSNMLGSMCLELDEQSRVISYEEYFPFGSTSYQGVATAFQNAAPKRYRYSGKERDGESGLYYYGARYFASWLGRWTSADPILDLGRNLYSFVLNNPVRLIDPDGRQSEPPDDEEEDLMNGGITIKAGPVQTKVGLTGATVYYTPEADGPMGTVIHNLIAYTLMERLLKAKLANPALPFYPVINQRTLPGGSKTLGSTRPGIIDFTLLTPDPANLGKMIAHLYEIKPLTPAEYANFQQEVVKYTKVFPPTVGSMPISQAIVGTDMALAAQQVPGLLGQITFNTKDFNIFVNISLAKDPTNRTMDGLIVYQLGVEVKYGRQLLEVLKEVKEFLKKEWRKIRDNIKTFPVIPILPVPTPAPAPAQPKTAPREVPKEVVAAGVGLAGVGIAGTIWIWIGEKAVLGLVLLL